MSKQKTKKSAWIIGALFATAIFAILASDPAEPPACPPMSEARQALFGLPDDQIEATTDFLNKAKRLRDQGICPVEGSFGRGHNKFYFSVHDAGKPKQLYQLRFTRDELRK